MRHTIALSTNLADLAGRKLEGTNLFTFATESDALAGSGAQLDSYEPTNGLARLTGTPGLAEPQSPVILVNETRGETATVLSKPDGSFDNFIPADVDDLLSAVIVNKNGTRNTIPVGRQLFRDGSVGLFSGGGVIEAQAENGLVQIIAEPGAIPQKTKFKLEGLSLAQVQQAAQRTEPAGGKVLGGFLLRTEGDALRSPAKVRFSVNPAIFDLPAGVRPEDAGFALTIPKTVDEQPVYEFVDGMRFEGGALVTDSSLAGLRQATAGETTPTSPGRTLQHQVRASEREAFPLVALAAIGFAMIKTANGNQTVVEGNARSAIFTGDPPAPTEKRGVPNATIFVNREGIALNVLGKVAPGATVASSSASGFFSLLVPKGALDPKTGAFSLLATSPLFPGQFGHGSAAVPADLDVQVAKGEILFNRSVASPTFTGADQINPTLSVFHSPQARAVGGTATLRILANDDRQIHVVTAVVTSVAQTQPGISVSSSDVTLTGPLNVEQTGQTLKEEFRITASKPLQAFLQIRAFDATMNSKTLGYRVEFGGTGPVLVNPTPDPSDTNAPFVTTSSPLIGAEGVSPGQPITVTFNEPIDPGFQQNLSLAFQLQPDAGTPSAALSPDRRTVRLNYYALKPGTDYTLLATAMIQDANGNGLDQNPYNVTTFESFSLPFRTAELPSFSLPGVVSGAGVVAAGRNLFVLDRSGPLKRRAGDYRRQRHLSNVGLESIGPQRFSAGPHHGPKLFLQANARRPGRKGQPRRCSGGDRGWRRPVDHGNRCFQSE